jgi:hypothetical protein
MQWFTDNIAGGVFYDLVKYYVLGPLIMALLGTGILRYAFHKLNERREQIVFLTGSFLVCIVLFLLVGTRAQQPNFIGGIQQAFSGALPGSDRDTIAVIALNIINTGNMQSIVKNWKVQATADGSTYDAAFVQMPPTFTFNNIPKITVNQPDSITFHAEDNIVEKSLKPIEVGAMLTGILFVEFPNVDQSVFRGGVAFDVSYEDVLSKSYLVSIKGNGQIGQVSSIAGLHTEMACPIPPGGLPKIQTNPLATPLPSPQPPKP